MDVNQAKRLKEPEAENARLKRMVADQPLGMEILQESLEKKLWARDINDRWYGDCSPRPLFRAQSLSSITLPEGVTNIGVSAFVSCSSLTSITFLGTAPTASDHAFSNVAAGARAIVKI